MARLWRQRLAGSVMAAALAPAGMAAAAEPLIDCWDASFAYTMVGVRPAGGGYELRLSSQDPSVFAPLFPDTELDWGVANLDLVLAEEACTVDPRGVRFSCNAEEAVATLTDVAFLDEPERSTTETIGDLAISFGEDPRVEAAEEPQPGRMLALGWQAAGAERSLEIAFRYHSYCSATSGWPGAFNQ
ncbi:MAG: hypothetical protein KDA49_11780 [Rhodospirillaceae bacterium]|nr:hypothetical protein [Rhodospirillaceae bacterium]MCA8933142.1 hypothetical protein [Rhodospirillaceae bacterium]